MAARRRRRWGTGSIYPSGERWVAQIVVRGPGGERRYVTRWRRNEHDAKLALDGLLARYGEGRGGDERQLLSRYLADWLDSIEPRLAPSTVRAYRQQVRLHIDPVIGGIALGDLRRVDVERMIRDGAKTLSAATIGNIVLTLATALERAVSDGLVPRNVARLANRPRVIREPVQAMTPAEAGLILAAAAETPYGALVALLLGSGLRIGEALALDWGDVDRTAGTVRVRHAKTPAGRRLVPLAQWATAALRRHHAAAKRVGPHEPVFVGLRSGRRMTSGTATHVIPDLLEKAGLPRRHAHELRHAHATLMLASGTDMRIIADQLGHSSPAITAHIYAHVLPASQRAAADRLGSLVKPTESLTERKAARTGRT